MPGFATDFNAATNYYGFDNRIWATWNNNLSIATTLTNPTAVLSTRIENNTIWRFWISGSGTTAGNIIVESSRIQPPPQPNIIQRAVIRRKPQKNRAEIKAETLLLKYLTRQQRKDYLEKKYFDIRVGPRTYRLKKFINGNVELLDKSGNPVIRYCCHPANDVPFGDVLMSQMMMLKYNEDGFLKLANVHWRSLAHAAFAA
jgi:hypothetical protein